VTTEPIKTPTKDKTIPEKPVSNRKMVQDAVEEAQRLEKERAEQIIQGLLNRHQ
jgi:hypothetical protein